jgi:hypothetical protein
MKRLVFQRGDRALYTGDGLTDIPCKVLEVCVLYNPPEYMIKLDGDAHPRRCETYQLDVLKESDEAQNKTATAQKRRQALGKV